MSRVIIDTGVLYAMADRDDAWHNRVKSYLEMQADILIVPITVLPEICYLLNRSLGQAAERKFIFSILHDELKVESLVGHDLQRASNLLEQYADANIGFVDATLVAIAERLKITRILTTDRRHFSLIRPPYGSRFELLP